VSRPSLIALTVTLLLSGCSSEPEPQPVPGAAQYQRAFDAALGAAGDAGIQVGSADRTAGRILGKKGEAEVSIWLQWQPDGKTKLEFTAPGSTETNPKLGERWLAAYQRRMGR
jgi:hypothetical protein